MSDAPETIWMDGDIEKGDGYWTRCFETEKPCSEPAIAYRRADLPPTTDQLLSDPRVEALVDGAQWARNRLEMIADESWHGDGRDLKRSIVCVFSDFDAALAQLKEPKP
jgi:hypothetical protein